jgi:hypothetical protein
MHASLTSDLDDLAKLSCSDHNDPKIEKDTSKRGAMRCGDATDFLSSAFRYLTASSLPPFLNKQARMHP